MATVVGITARQFDIPLDCPCCGAPADTEVSIKLARDHHDRAADSVSALDIPYCRHCVAHVTAWESARLLLTGWIVIGIVAFVVLAIVSGAPLAFIALAATIVLGVVLSRRKRHEARRMMRESCGSVTQSVAYLGWTGTSTLLAFESLAYAGRFAERNLDRLADDPKIRKLLDHYKLARLAVPTPAAAITIPPPLSFGDWVERLASTGTRVARRSTLATALEMFHDPRERDQLVRSVCAIEIATACAGIDKLAPPAARRRLQAIFDNVRRDNVPPLLQEMMLRELQQRINRLDAG